MVKKAVVRKILFGGGYLRQVKDLFIGKPIGYGLNGRLAGAERKGCGKTCDRNCKKLFHMVFLL